MRLAGVALLLLAASATAADFAGEYVTSRGFMVLTQEGSEVTGTFGEGAKNTITGKVRDAELDISWRTLNSGSGTGVLRLSEKGRKLGGTWKRDDGRDQGVWSGWRRDPEAESHKPGRFGGQWRSSMGLLDLKQKGTTISGTYGAQGWGEIEGEVKGRRIFVKWSWPGGSGTAWIEIAPGCRELFGMGKGADGGEWKLFGHLLEGYDERARPKPGRIVHGLAENRMTYCIRVPTGWRAGRKTPAIVLLHGMNMNAEAYVATVARAWPELADRYVLIGIDGERWNDASGSESPAHNYTYVNWTGRSELKGFPNTHRESPALVHEVVLELRQRHRLDRIFVGGHSQGGYLTYVLYGHFPETFAGAFPMAGGVIVQAEPDAFDGDERRDLRAAQRATPLAIVHGEQDGNVPFSSSLYAEERFLAHGFPMVALFPRAVGHGFALLPVPDAVRWLDALSTEDASELVAFAERSLAARHWRDVGSAVMRGEQIRVSGKAKRRLAAVAERYDAAARPGAEQLAPLLAKNENATWLPAFLDWRADFELAPSAGPVMAAYEKLRAVQDEPAEKCLAEARKAFRDGDRDKGMEKYREILEKYPAAAIARCVHRWVAEYDQ